MEVFSGIPVSIIVLAAIWFANAKFGKMDLDKKHVEKCFTGI